MPTYSKHARHFRVQIIDNEGQMRTTVPKPLYDRLDEQEAVEGTFRLTKETIVFSLPAENDE